MRSSNQNTRSANYQSSPNEEEVEQEAEVMERDRRRRQRDKDRRRDQETKFRNNFAPSLEDDSSDAENPVPLNSSNLKNTSAPSNSSDSDGKSGSKVTGGHCPPPRPTPVQRKTSQPSPELRQPPMRRSETVPVDRTQPGNHVPLKSSNLKNTEPL